MSTTTDNTTSDSAAAKDDGALIREVVSSGSQASFQQLVERHSPMVLGACRRQLGEGHDADDAAQAVFIVLWKKTSELRKRDSIAGWLHRVARNVCMDARKARRIRQQREGEAAQMSDQQESSNDVWEDVREHLDNELNCLPEKYRLPIILFHLEGRSQEEIAVLLHTKRATVATRLSRAREMLRSRLVRRGVTVSVTALAGVLTAGTCSAAVPSGFVSSTVHAATLFAAGKLTAGGALTAQTASLSKGAINMLFVAKLKTAAAVVATTTILVGGGTAVVQHVAQAEQQKPAPVAAAKPLASIPALPAFVATNAPVVKKYPALRVAIAAGGDSEVETLANEQPLLITLDPDDTVNDGIRLAATSTIVSADTQLGWDGDVFVKEWPTQQVLSMGYRGPIAQTELRKKVEVLWDQVTGRDANWSPDGPPRLVVYDDGSTAPEARRFEVQLPTVTREQARQRAKERMQKQPPPDATAAEEMEQALADLASIIRSWKSDAAKLQRLARPYRVESDGQSEPAERLEKIASSIEKSRFAGSTLSGVSKLGDRRMFEPLATLLEHPRWVIRREAAFALGYQDAARAVPVVLQALNREKEWDARYRDGVIAGIVYALGQLGDPRAIDPIQKTMLEDMHDGSLTRERYRAVDGPYTYVSQIPFKLALAMLGEEEYLPVVRAYARDTVMGPSGGIAILMEMGDSQVYDILLEHLRSEESSYRLMAIRELVELGDEKAVAAIKPLLKDDDEAVRAAAMWAMKELAGSTD